MSNKKNKKTKKDATIKTFVKPDNTVEVEMKSPSKTKGGRLVVWILVIGMGLFGIVGLIWLIIANWSSLV